MEGKSKVCGGGWGDWRGSFVLLTWTLWRGEEWCCVLGLAIGLVCGDGVGLGLATVWRMVRWGVDAARWLGLEGCAGVGEASLVKTSLSDGTFCAEMVCHGEPRAVLALTCASFSLADDCALAACCCCSIFLRSFCDNLGAGRLEGDGPALSAAAFCDSMPCESDEVRPDDACAMISFSPVLEEPAKGVAVHGSPVLDGVLPASGGDFGVRGVIAPGVEDCCGRGLGEVTDLPLESSQPSSIGDSEGI
jgi:hypothetical protein